MGSLINERRPRCMGRASRDGEGYRGATREGVSLTSKCRHKATSEPLVPVVTGVRR